MECIERIRQSIALSLAVRYIFNQELRRPITIPDSQMRSFIAVSGNYEEQIVYLDPIATALQKGDRVRVIGGIFEGVDTPPQKRIVRSKSQTITPQQFPPNYIPSASLNQPQPSFSPYSQQSVMQAQPSAAFQNNPVEAKIQKLQEEWESDVQKAFRKQRLRFDNCALVEDFQGCLTYQCSNGENTIVKPFSPCRNLRAQKIIEHDTKKESIKYTFDTPTGEHKSVIVDATCSALHRYNLLRDNGFIVIAHLLPTVCGELIARYTAATRDSIPPQIKYSPGWYFSENHWGFQESE